MREETIEQQGVDTAAISLAERVKAHIQIARLDHSVKQIFILPGVVLAFTITSAHFDAGLARRIVVGFIAATLIACSNYVINEMLDAPYDRMHPTKKNRPAARGVVHFGWGYAQWILMMVAGLALGATISWGFVATGAVLWIMGCLYNIPPARTKELPYLDVLSESVNNPLRFLLGWYMVTAVAVPPLSLLIAYWMLGTYFMTLKRFSEYRQIANPAVAASYRKSFGYYTERSLLNSVVFYAATAMLFFGAFIIRYRLELILSFPLIAWLMAVYFSLSFQDESAVQNPEKLYREPQLMVPLVLCSAVLIVLMFVNLPWLIAMFPKSTW